VPIYRRPCYLTDDMYRSACRRPRQRLSLTAFALFDCSNAPQQFRLPEMEYVYCKSVTTQFADRSTTFKQLLCPVLRRTL